MASKPKAVLSCLAALLVLTGCSTVTFVRVPEAQTRADPVYEASAPFFFLGLVGGPADVYADRICLKQEIDQIVTEYTAANVLTAAFTLGIYSPRTVKVWCSL